MAQRSNPALWKPAGSSGRCNTRVKAFLWSFKLQSLARRGARRASGQLRPLRDLKNQSRLPSSGGARWAPHELSEILTGALFSVMVRMHEDRKRTNPNWSSGKALFVAAEQFKRMVLRALDYLPPGEISFADYGRAITAADAALHPTSEVERSWIAEEFRKRSIIKNEDELQVRFNGEQISDLNNVLSRMDLETLVKSDWAAYTFARENRELLGIPAGIPLYVRPRLNTAKKYWLGPNETQSARECIFKVSWDTEEQNPAMRGLPERRQITVGMTLAIDWEKRTVRTLLTSDSADHEGTEDRDGMLLQLHEEGRLAIGHAGLGPDGKPLRSAVLAETSDGLLRIRKSARMLHVQGERYG